MAQQVDEPNRMEIDELQIKAMACAMAFLFPNETNLERPNAPTVRRQMTKRCFLESIAVMGKTRLARPKVLEYVIIRLAVPLAISALGITFMTMKWFVSGVILLYTGLLLTAIDVAYEDLFRKLPRWFKVVIGSLYVLGIVIASHLWIFVPAPIAISAQSTVPSYGPGSNVHGIDWKPYYSRMDFVVNNPTSTDYDDVDIEVSTDLVIRDVRKTSGLSDCKIAGTHPPLDVTVQAMVGNQPVGPANDPRNPRQYVVIPRDKYGRPLLPASGTDWSYRIQCDRIPSNSQVGFLMALAVVDENFLKTYTGPLFAPPKPATWVSLQAKYQTSGRQRNEAVTRCPIGHEKCIVSGKNLEIKPL